MDCWVGVDGWVNGWGPGQIIKNRINLDLIKIIQFCLKVYDLLTHPHLWMGVWVVGWMGGLIYGSMGGSSHITKNRINLELIEIIKFCLKICDLLRHPHLWAGVWVVGWMGGLICWSMGGSSQYN